MVKRLGNNIYARPPDGSREKRNKHSWTVLYGRYLAITTQNISMVGAGGILGWLLDRQFNTDPYLFVTGIFIGAGAGFYHLVRSLNVLNKKSDD